MERRGPTGATCCGWPLGAGTNTVIADQIAGKHDRRRRGLRAGPSTGIRTGEGLGAAPVLDRAGGHDGSRGAGLIDDSIPVLEVGGTRDRRAGDRRPVGPGPGLAHDRTVGCRRHCSRAARRSCRRRQRPSAGTPIGLGRGGSRSLRLRAGGGLFRDVGKFDSLYGVDVRRGLMLRIRPSPSAVRFLNDADAFGLASTRSEPPGVMTEPCASPWAHGVGSAFLDRGRPVNSGPTVPPDGSIHLVVHDGRPIEETVSRRAIRTAYATSRVARRRCSRRARHRRTRPEVTATVTGES